MTTTPTILPAKRESARSIALRTHRIAVAALAVSVLSLILAASAHAQTVTSSTPVVEWRQGWHTAPKQQPDDFSNAPEHFMIMGALPGIVTTILAPDMHPIKQWALCQIPGAIHEFAPSKGNYRSNRDLLVNSLGCAFGVSAGHGFWVKAQGDGAMVYRAWEFK